MSSEAMDWAWEQDIRTLVSALPDADERRAGCGIAKTVLLFLGRCHHHATGLCCPSLDTIVAKVEHTKASVRKAITLLIDLGLVEKHQRKSTIGRVTTPQYKLVMADQLGGSKTHPQPTHVNGFGGSKMHSQKQPKGEFWGVENDSFGGAKTTPESSIEVQEKKKGAHADSEGKQARQASKSADAREREPTVAEIEAQRRAYAAELGDKSDPISLALRRMGEGITGKAYAPGWGPRRDADEQIELLSTKRVKPAHLSAEMLAVLRQGRRMPAFAGASP